MRRWGLLLVTTLLLTACQRDTCRIRGEAKGWKDGTLLYLSVNPDNGHPFDSIRVDGGRFDYLLTTDSIRLCLLYPSTKSPSEGVYFFTEPGNIYIELLPKIAASRVSGTVINNEWQALNNDVAHCDRRLRRIMREAKDSINVRRLHADINRLYEDINKNISETAMRNRDNALGQFINSHYRKE